MRGPGWEAGGAVSGERKLYSWPPERGPRSRGACGPRSARAPAPRHPASFVPVALRGRRAGVSSSPRASSARVAVHSWARSVKRLWRRGGRRPYPGTGAAAPLPSGVLWRCPPPPAASRGPFCLRPLFPLGLTSGVRHPSPIWASSAPCVELEAPEFPENARRRRRWGWGRWPGERRGHLGRAEAPSPRAAAVSARGPLAGGRPAARARPCPRLPPVTTLPRTPLLGFAKGSVQGLGAARAERFFSSFLSHCLSLSLAPYFIFCVSLPYKGRSSCSPWPSC